MNPDQLIHAYLDMGIQELSVFPRFLADHLYTATLRDGRPVRYGDAITVKEWLEELSDALVFHDFPASTELQSLAVSRTRPEVMRTCPRCGHVHEGSAECGAEMGPGRVCRCEMEVGV